MIQADKQQSIVPSVILINSMPYQVVEEAGLRPQEEDYQRLYGYIQGDKMQISIEKNMQPQMKTAVLIHEVIHGILDQAGVSEHDEQLINILTYGFIGVMRQNPELAQLVIQ